MYRRSNIFSSLIMWHCIFSLSEAVHEGAFGVACIDRWMGSSGGGVVVPLPSGVKFLNNHRCQQVDMQQQRHSWE